MAAVLPLVALLLAGPAAAPPLQADRIERLAGVPGTREADGSFHLVVPSALASRRRTRLTPALELGSWARFTPDGEEVALTAAFVVTPDQAGPAVAAALDAGLEVTAFDDHFFWDDPKLRALHLRGRGSEEAMATAVGRVVQALRAPSRRHKLAVRRADPELVMVVGPLLGEGRLEDGLFRLAFGAAPGRPAVASGEARAGAWAAFAGLPSRAMVAGDMALPSSGLQAVLRRLRASGFEIAAVHPQPSDQGAAFVVLSYWGVGTAAALSQGLKDALKLAGVVE